MRFFLLLILFLHIAVYALFFWYCRRTIIQIPAGLFLIVILIPIWGGICALLVNHNAHHERQGSFSNESGNKQWNSYKNTISEIKSSGVTVVPLEEAMVINDSSIRRSLILNVLNKNMDQHVDLFRTIACAGDVETTHYAVTALSELQKDYELLLRDAQRAYLQSNNYQTLIHYSEVLLQYISSGLIEGELLDLQRKRLSALLEKLRAEPLKDCKLYLRLVENEMDLEHYTVADELLDELIRQWENNEDMWILKLNLLSKMNRDEDIRLILKRIKEKNIYFSPSGNSVINFWSRVWEG